MLMGRPADIANGGACVFQLPRDPSAVSKARSLIAATMRAFPFAADMVEDAKLAVSEVTTNALAHAASTACPELWVWARTRPVPELVVSVFDAHRDTWPVADNGGLLDEHGRGMSIVAAFSTDAGSHLTRSRLTRMSGKCVWFRLPLPEPWPGVDRVIAPRVAAERLSEVLRARGVLFTCRSDDSGISVLTLGARNVWVEPKSFSWRDGRGYVRQPLIDLQETAERIVSFEEWRTQRKL
ncbi:ATP-binding protein [Actinomadura fibrosa]|uniref:ATP-binding protein n=1 Tax=Actinomadura fibrosa TaxID=111802 RepID=A0ABW2XKZ9_9ACTN|nr:ATP-binding protein [Actinomadura fibrosa]